MSLKQWSDNGWLRPHRTSRQEIGNLLGIVHRDLKDAQSETLSADWRFGIAYNAALKLCSILLYAAGFRPTQNLAHYRTLQALPLILGSERKPDADYLGTCRAKRNTVEYDYVGGVTKADAEELADFARKLEDDVVKWLATRYPELLPKDSQ